MYCTHCGAPQIFLAEELQQELEDNARSYFEQTTAAEAEPAAASGPALRRAATGLLQRRPDESPWTTAMRFALLSGAGALALGLLSLAVPPVGLLLLIWIMSAPMLTVAFFQARTADAGTMSFSFQARLGLLTGMLVAACSAIVFVLSMVLSRYVFHDAGVLDAQLAASFEQQRAVLTARLGAEVQPTMHLLTIPEFRVGMLLTVMATCAVFYLLLSTLTAGITGLLVRRRR